MLYRWLQGIPAELTGEDRGVLWAAFNNQSLFYSILFAFIFALATVLYLRFVYKIVDTSSVYSIQKRFWLALIISIILHTILLYWLSFLVFGGTLLNALITTVFWRARLYNALASNLEFVILFYVFAKLISLAFSKTRTLLWPRRPLWLS